MRVKTRIKHLAERAFNVRIVRRLPLGSDVYNELRSLTSWSPAGVLFDVGAHFGETALQLAAAFPDAEVYSFEPSRPAFERLVKRSQRLERVRCFNFGFGSSRRQATLFLHRVSDQNTMREDLQNRSGYESRRHEPVEVRTVDEFMQEQGIEFVQYLKIDTEGYDIEVLKGASAALAAGRIGLVEVEAGFHQDGGKFIPLEEFSRHLGLHDFLLFGIYEQVRARNTQLRRCNAVFISKKFAQS